jgi:apolipoprotein N-acyltransferase
VLAFLWPQLASAFVADALPAAVSTYFLQPAWVGWSFAIGIWAITGSVYYMAFAPAYRALARRFTGALPLLAGAAWAAMELGRGRLFTGSSFFVGNPWALIGYSQADWLPLVQIASWTGIYGVSFVLVAVNAGVAELWWAWRRGEAGARRRAAAGLVLAGLPALVAVGYGHAVLRAAPAAESAANAVPIAIVQGNLDLGSRWQSEFYGRNIAEYLLLTRRALQEGAGGRGGAAGSAPMKPSIVFWPEGALTFFLEEDEGFRRAIGRVLAAGDVELMVGGPRSAAEPSVYFNTIFLLSESGEMRGRYDKQYLVPFSEYFPLRQLDLVRRRFERVRSFTHGAPTPPLPTRAGPAGVLVCNEAMLPEVAGARVHEGAVYLVNPSNDTWIARPKWADMMFDLVSLRAVEQRRYLVRASTAGPSAVVDPWGRVSGRTQPFSQDLVLSRIVPRTERSVYGRVGDLFAFTCLASVLVAIVAGRRRAPRSSTGGSRSPRTRPRRASPRRSQ